MLKPLGRQPWICSRCLRQQRIYKRGLVTAAAAAVQQEPDLPLASHSAPGILHDDRTLRQIFDSESVWREFSQSSRHGQHRKPGGLFQNTYLTRPEGFNDFAAISLQKCKNIVAKVLKASTIAEYKVLARELDRLSDLLCRVIDLSDFVRNTHPDRRIQAAATQAYALMFEYMNVLNTTTELNEQLKKAKAIPEVWSSWTEEEKLVADILIKDFSKSAIDLPDEARQKFVDLSNDISQLGPEFVDEMAPEMPQLYYESSRMKGMDPRIVKQLTRWGSVTLPTFGSPAMIALRTVEDPDVRRELYIANRTAQKKGIHKLELLLKKRAELSRLSGHETFAHLALSDKMAKSPEAVNNFLTNLAQDNQDRVKLELSQLLELKKSDSYNKDSPSTINAWDRDYYTTRLLSTLRSRTRSPDFLHAYFSLGTVMQGLSRLFHRLYGIRFVPREPMPGETWNNDVRRLDVVDETSGNIAVVYCDLFQRDGKNPNPAHFTLRCSRRISSEEVLEADTLPNDLPTSLDAITDGMASAINPSDPTKSLYQLPTIALICDFARGGPAHRPTLLSLREVQTLFHEMGHAVHSILGRTALQSVSGTRCATDFAELPSILMENFASAPEVLALYARHWETDQAVPYELVKEKVDLDARMRGAENESQILLALLDQALHSSLPSSPDFSSTATYHDICDRYGSVPEPLGTSWQGFFGHLFGYGATYYSYLFDRAIAGKIWRDVFQRSRGGAVDRENGERFRSGVLRWGGARDGWACVGDVLGDERLKEGGAEAMAEVGRWGVWK